MLKDWYPVIKEDCWKFLNIKMVKTKEEVKKVVKKSVGLTVPVYDVKGKEKGELELPKEAFAYKINKPLIAQSLRVYQFNQRQGTASAKTRGEVKGSTRKIYRQKGTGRARHGSNKAPIFVGGGVVGGPKPRDYSLNITEKQKRIAIFSALSLLLKEKKIVGLEDKALEIEPKTKQVAQLIRDLKLVGKKIVFVLPKMEKSGFVLACRNVPEVSLVEVRSLNIFQILNCGQLIFLKESVEVFKKHFLKN